MTATNMPKADEAAYRPNSDMLKRPGGRGCRLGAWRRSVRRLTALCTTPTGDGCHSRRWLGWCTDIASSDDNQRVSIPAHEWIDLRIQQRGPHDEVGRADGSIAYRACPSSDDLRHIAGLQKGGSG